MDSRLSGGAAGIYFPGDRIMSELIKAACDICGQQYRWRAERLDQEAVCKVCGTEFLVKEYVPSQASEEGEHDSPWPWIKGGFTAMLMLTILVVLGRLPFIKPNVSSKQWWGSALSAGPRAKEGTSGGTNLAPHPISKQFRELRGKDVFQAEAFQAEHDKQMEESGISLTPSEANDVYREATENHRALIERLRQQPPRNVAPH